MRKRSHIYFLILILVFLGVVFSFPLVFHFNSAIPYSLYPAPGFELINMMHGDHMQFFYTLSLFGDYIREKNTAFFAEPYEFTLTGRERPYSPRELPLSILFFILSPLGNIAAYNILVLFSFIACGVSVWLLSGKYVKGFLPRLIPSILFSIFPFRLAQLCGGHPNGFIVFFIPLMLYGYESWYQTGKWKYALLSGFCIMSMAVEELHLAYYSGFLTVAFLIYRGISELVRNKQNRKETLQRFIWLTIVIAFLWILAAAYLMHVRSTVVEPSIASGGRELGEISLYAPQAGDFFRRTNSDSEKYIYLGIVSLLLSLCAFCKPGRNIFSGGTHTETTRMPSAEKDRWFYLAVFLVSAILSLGPNLRIFPLYNFFYRFVPFFSYPRSTGRIIVLAFLSVSILAGMGIGNLLTKKKGKIIVVAAVILLMLDFYPFGKTGLCRLNSGNKVYEHIKQQNYKGVILEVPLWPGNSSWSSIYEYYATIYHIPMINVYCPFVTRDYIENVFWPLVSINMGCIDKKQFDLLKELNVDYIILHEEAYPGKVSPFPFKIALSNMKNCPMVKFVKQDGPVYLFKLEKDFEGKYVPYSIPSKMGVLYECEYLPTTVSIVSFDVKASGGLVRYTDEDIAKGNFSVFGPYVLFPPGKYKAIFRIRGKPVSSDADFARIEVTANKGQDVIAERIIKGREAREDYFDYELSFDISVLKELEFRIGVFGNGKIWADYIYLLFQGEKDPVVSFEAEDMFHTGREFSDREASGGISIYGNPSTDSPDRIVFGGKRRYPKGSYIASFRIKISKRSKKTAARIKVLLSGSGIVMAEKEVDAAMFDEIGKYMEAKLPFSLKKMQVLDFQVDFTGETGLWVDRINIKKIGDIPAEDETSESEVPYLPPDTPDSAFGNGLLRFTYRGIDFSGKPAVKAELKPAVYFSAKKKHEPFSVIWLGYLKIDKEGEYRIGTLSDNGSHVYIGDKQVVDNSGKHLARYVESKIYLKQGYHRLKIKYIAMGEDELFRLYWMEPGNWPAVVFIPGKNLFHRKD